MTPLETQPEGPIDAVITWVDGKNETHQRQRHFYMANAIDALHENATNPHRWACNDEITFCLQSIANHAPWIRHIWIVSAEGLPNISAFPSSFQSKVHLVTHAEIFYDFDDALPTFNSLAIESLIWRISGLSERFLYFNDDVFLTKHLDPADVFDRMSPVLRGKWVDSSELTIYPSLRADPAKFNHFMQLNAATMLGHDPSKVFFSSHVVHPLRRSKMKQLFARYPHEFEQNVRHRFRDLKQFLPHGLHNHQCIADNEARISTARDYLHVRSGQGIRRPPIETRSLLRRAINTEIKFLCINDLPQLEDLIPDARCLIGRAIG